MAEELTTEQVAELIDSRLKTWEASKKHNPERRGGTHSYYKACAWEINGKVGVKYVTYQDGTTLSRSEAIWYLELIRKGFIGRHFEAFRQFGQAKSISEDPANLFRYPKPGSRPAFLDGQEKTHPRLTKAYYTLLEIVAPSVKANKATVDERRSIRDIVPKDADRYQSAAVFDEVRLASPALKAALNSLFMEIKTALHAASERGESAGTNLLVQLAKGKITADDLSGTRRKDKQ